MECDVQVLKQKAGYSRNGFISETPEDKAEFKGVLSYWKVDSSSLLPLYIKKLWVWKM